MSDVEGCPRRRETGAVVFLGLMILIGSSTATAAKFAVRGLPVGLLPIVRFGGAGLLLLPFAGGGRTLARLIRQDGWRLAAAAALCVPINQAFFLYGTRLAPTTHVGLIYATCPLIVLALACVLGQERLGAGRLFGIVASVSGAAVIGLGNLWDSGSAAAGALRGDLLLIGAVLSWGAYLTLNKPLVDRHGSLAVLAATFLLGAALDLPIALASTPGWGRALADASPSAWWGLAHLTLIVSPVGLACQNQALRRLEASQVAAVGNAAPALTVLWGVWLLGESLTSAVILGGALTLAGIVWVSRPARQPVPGPLSLVPGPRSFAKCD